SVVLRLWSVLYALGLLCLSTDVSLMLPRTSKRKRKSDWLTPEQDAFLGAATAEYNEKLNQLNRDWGFADYQRWDFDQFSGVLRLTMKDGSKVEADCQALGSYWAKGKSWEWSWNNPHVEDGLKVDAQKVREFGKREGIEYLVKPMVPVPDK